MAHYTRYSKDETRQKILLLLDERKSISYTDLMNALGIGSTGKLNYHLKILNELIVKEEGLYSLTEKGKLALRLLQEFCEKKSQSESEAPFPKGYMIVVGLFSVILLTVVFGLFVAGLISLERFVLFIVTSVLGIVFLVVAEKARVKRAMSRPEKQMLGAKISIVASGAFAGGVILFFGGGLLLVGLSQIGVHIRLFSFNWWMITSSVVGAVVGGLIGYWVYKRSKLSKKAYYDPF